MSSPIDRGLIMPTSSVLIRLPDSCLRLRRPIPVSIEKKSSGKIVARLRDVGLLLEGHGTTTARAKVDLAHGIVEQYYAVRPSRKGFARCLCRILQEIVEEA